MSYETVPQGETGGIIVPAPSQQEVAKKLFARHWKILDVHAILEHVVVTAPDLPPGRDTSARVYRIVEGEGAAQKERGGVCLFPAGDPASPFRVNVDVYEVFGTVPMPVNKFTDEQMDVVRALLDELDMERQFDLPNLSPDYTHIALPIENES